MKGFFAKYGGIVPAYAWFIVLLVFPLLYIAVISFFTTGDNGWGVTFAFTLENYRRMGDPLYLGIIAKSFTIALYSTLITLLIGYPFAYFITFFSRKTQRALLFLTALPFWINAMVRTYGWIILLQKRGIFNSLLSLAGIEPLNLLYTGGAVLAGTVYTLLPFMILPVYNSLEKIDYSFVEASRDLGAGPWRSFFTVILRQSMPGVISGCLLVFIPSIGLFYVSDLLGGSNTILLGNLIRNQFIGARNWPFGAALSVIMTVLAVILIRLYKRASGGERVEMFI